jgi:D-lactate dehydrogenase (cytochrome)
LSTSGIVETLAQTHGGRQFQWSTDVAERERLWRARHDAYPALLAMRSGSVGYVTDVYVPISRLADSVAHAKATLSGCSIPAAMLGHVGDGNFHVVFLIDPEAPAELEYGAGPWPTVC